METSLATATSNIDSLLDGLKVTISLTVLSIAAGSILGAVIALLSLMTSAFRYLAYAYIELFLSVPALVLLIWLYYVLPFVSPALMLPGFAVSVLGLSLSLSAFVAEIIRAGIATVSKGQLEAALILGVPRIVAWRRIVFPQALRTMWPALFGQFITTYKFSTLASVVAVGELLHTGELVIAQTYQPIEVYSVIALFFIVTIIPLNLLSRSLTRPSSGGVISL